VENAAHNANDNLRERPTPAKGNIEGKEKGAIEDCN
jgi:hypothetical protein